ncbi:mannose-6-phosphate isomerase, class I [Kitasatospora herbaricolor]|uniref:mannose-6-phosphate isomerase, class I n=1 Tax=Kitasatospora herbaricolor TaxID=68217 RepID=UPI00174939FB|nr:mannose-6-phosphate isomerase, class I [Kitasatospora herbaricolor]MDQ0306754.1 mannose-6-phosphate isomerase [Kitasatospora herbaricolor]GGV44468.1 mannose-6-phosphate isomerase, class I [Kitasatospora herbaricolor]
MSQSQPPAGLLTNQIRPYAWGSRTAIARLTGRTPGGGPEAELWMGAHPGAPSRTDRGDGPEPLDRVIARDPVRELGESVTGRFGPRLPFLMKILAAEHALSVQVHPTTAQAEAGFAAEEEAGIPLDAPHRIYRDPHHKPEMLCALSGFDALCGFREPAATADLLAALHLPVLDHWIGILRTAEPETALRTVLTEALGTDRPRGTAAALALAAALEDAAGASGPDAGTYAAYAGAARDYPADPGLVAALLLNHVRLQPGEALYLDAGVPHAYLHGTGVEVMANSDNVLRCGLTPKHVDVDALAAVVDFRPGPPSRVPATPGPGGEVHYRAPAAEFALSRLDLPGTVTLDDDGPQILLCTEGSAALRQDPAVRLTLGPGASAFLPAAGAPAELTGAARLYRVRVGSTQH